MKSPLTSSSMSALELNPITSTSIAFVIMFLLSREL
jgi:hypothetical protein